MQASYFSSITSVLASSEITKHHKNNIQLVKYHIHQKIFKFGMIQNIEILEILSTIPCFQWVLGKILN